jgi:quercetin dioxygenase-like cupin family protein
MAEMDIKRSGSQPSQKGPEDYFTGTVRIDARFSGSGGLGAATVAFEPGAEKPCPTWP